MPKTQKEKPVEVLMPPSNAELKQKIEEKMERDLKKKEKANG